MGLRQWNQDQRFNLAARSYGVAADVLADLIGRHAVASLDQGDTGKRFTATRLVVFGPLGLAAKKRTGHAYLTFAVGDRAIYQLELSRTVKQGAVRDWIAEFNRRAA